MPNTYLNVHRDFKLDGIAYDASELKEVAYSLIKEGALYERQIGDFLSDWLDHKPTLKVQTSGSTGTPKISVLQKRHMVNSAKATAAFFDLNPGNSALLCLPAEYIAGKMMLVRAMVLGLELDFVEPSSAPLEAVTKTYDFCAMVPLQFENSLPKIEQLKTLIVGGAQLSNTLKVQAEQKTTAIYETYGMTETCTHVAVRIVELNKVENNSELNSDRSRIENNFKALPDVSFSKDDRGCLVIDAQKVTTKQVVTNDMVDLISETEFKWLGRFDNVVNSGGIKLQPERIEARLSQLIKQPFFVTGIEDDHLGQKLILLIEGGAKSDTILAKIAKTKTLERYEIPKAVYWLPQFVSTKNGKFQRKETLKLLQR